MDIFNNKKPHIKISTLFILSIGMFLSSNPVNAKATTTQLAAKTEPRKAFDSVKKKDRKTEKPARKATDKGLATVHKPDKTARTTAIQSAKTEPRKAVDSAKKNDRKTEKPARKVANKVLSTGHKPEETVRKAVIQSAVIPLLAKIDTHALLLTEQSQVRLTHCGNGNSPQRGSCHYAIGDRGPAGGFVFYIINGGIHGLEAAPVDQGRASWGCFGTDIPGANGTTVGVGAKNTSDILASAGCGDTGIAAKIADDYKLNGYTDWFLPSKDELNLMYTNIGQGATAPLTNLGNFANVSYWSSTEYGSLGAYFQHFPDGSQYTYDEYNMLSVRAVRAF